MKFPIPFCSWTGRAALEIEIPDSTEERFRLKVALEVAVRDNASLVGASLVGARLDGASLVGARLDNASLVGASLVGARLDRASLVGARLDGASLVGARLDGASLDRASLVGARLDDASLVGASLVGASLDGASLDGAQLRSYRTDLFDVLLRAPKEVDGLLLAVREGRINGSTYTGECACLVGTIANVRGCDVEALDYRDSSRPIEQWFMMIKPGDKPETSQAAKMAEQWITEFRALTTPVAA